MGKRNHFRVSKENNELYIIKENISEVNPIYRNDPLNLYLIIGNEKAVLLDTGCGLYPLKPIIEDLIYEKELIVINTHAHWDHILGNHEFGEVYIHRNEANIVSHPYDISFLKNSPYDIVKRYEEDNYLIPPADNIYSLSKGDIFDLGDIKVEIIHAPGHSSGSICLLTDNNMLFTGDVAYYGDIFLPERKKIPKVLNSLNKLINLCKKENNLTIYPSHRKTPCKITLLYKLLEEIKNIDKIWNTKQYNEFFSAWELNSNNFTFLVSKF